VPQVHTLGATTNFNALASTGTAPRAAAIGVIGRFVMLGNLADSGSTLRPYTVAWPAIDNPRNWPTPLSATATAVQSGEQLLNSRFGPVSAIGSGDQFGVVFQKAGLTRVTYVGPPVVFQFDQLSSTEGAYFKNAVASVDGLHYFVSSSGFFVTDGVTVQSIGNGKVDKFFFEHINSSVNETAMTAAVDFIKKLIYWKYVDSSGVGKVLIFNYREKRWSNANQEAVSVFTAPSGHLASSFYGAVYGFSSANRVGWFIGTPGTATITTAEMELTPGGRSFVDGVKPNVLSTSTAPAVTVRVGSRSDLATTTAYTATTTPTTRTGFADCRVDAKYHRAEVQIVGNFDKAVGLEFKARPSGMK